MTEIVYRTATNSDIILLAKYRIEFLTGLLGQQPAEQTEELRQQLEKYFRTAIDDGSIICWLAMAGDEVAGTGAMTIRSHPGSFKNPTGTMGYIINMYTVPQYRKRGICKTLLGKLLDAGKAMGITAFELHATKEGEPVYQKAGFEQHIEPTYRKYQDR
ncbi:MAG: Acetyltransferase [Flavipsychrobacter sp.]|nr:Acetyltransferase [Flavipsychrobacter sp.]